MHLARFASSVYHTSFQMSLFFSWFLILSQFNLLLWIIPTYYKIVLFTLWYARSASRFEAISEIRVTKISLKHITPDVILRNLIKVPTTYLVSRWPLSDVEKRRPRKLKPRKHWPRKHWPRKRSLCITWKTFRLLCKQFSLCYSLVMRAIGWATESFRFHPKFSLSFPFFGDFFFFLTPSFFFATFPSRHFLSRHFVATFTAGSKHNPCGKMASSATDDALKEVKWS